MWQIGLAFLLCLMALLLIGRPQTWVDLTFVVFFAGLMLATGAAIVTEAVGIQWVG